MTTKGFIIPATFQVNPETSHENTDLHIEGMQDPTTAVIDPDDHLLRIYVEVNGSFILFSPDEAKTFLEAIEEILDRYGIFWSKTEEDANG